MDENGGSARRSRVTLSAVPSQVIFMADDNATPGPKQLGVAQAETEQVIQPHGVANDCDRKPSR
jgi:hypothetical protein